MGNFKGVSEVGLRDFLSVNFINSSSPMVLCSVNCLQKYILPPFCPAKRKIFEVGGGSPLPFLPYVSSLSRGTMMSVTM